MNLDEGQQGVSRTISVLLLRLKAATYQTILASITNIKHYINLKNKIPDMILNTQTPAQMTFHSLVKGHSDAMFSLGSTKT